MSRPSFVFVICCVLLSACMQNSSTAQSGASAKRVGGPCEGCEAIYENPLPFRGLSEVLELPGWNSDRNKLEISGTVYKNDGVTPAAGVVLYVYHTDQKGRYPTKGDERGWAKRHGYLRGWLKTNDKGQYTIRTQRPASYPGTTAPAHIHCIVKESGLNEYSIGDFLFADDPFLSGETENDTKKFPGGSGVLRTTTRNGIAYATRNIYLGRDVQDYVMKK